MKISIGLEYKVIENGLAVICGLGSCTDEQIVIPTRIDGFSVVGIAQKAFSRSLQIKSVIIPCSVRFIEEHAFSWCRELTEIRISNIVHIGDRAFMGCDKLSLIDLGGSIEHIGNKAFAYCPALVSVSLPRGLKTLGSSAFEGCRGLCSVSFSSGINAIENSTFYACEKLRKIILPKHLDYIDEYAFAYCVSLVEINIPSRTVINSEAFFECGSLCGNGKVS